MNKEAVFRLIIFYNLMLFTFKFKITFACVSLVSGEKIVCKQMKIKLVDINAKHLCKYVHKVLNCGIRIIVDIRMAEKLKDNNIFDYQQINPKTDCKRVSRNGLIKICRKSNYEFLDQSNHRDHPNDSSSQINLERRWRSAQRPC